MRKIWATIFFLLFCFVAIGSVMPGIADTSLSKKIIAGNKTKDIDTTYRIITKADKTYGYEIVVNHRTLIRQYTIPGQQGMHGFKRKKDAEQVAMLVIKKIKQGIMPPTIRLQELKQLNIIF